MTLRNIYSKRWYWSPSSTSSYLGGFSFFTFNDVVVAAVAPAMTVKGTATCSDWEGTTLENTTVPLLDRFPQHTTRQENAAVVTATMPWNKAVKSCTQNKRTIKSENGKKNIEFQLYWCYKVSTHSHGWIVRTRMCQDQFQKWQSREWQKVKKWCSLP